MGHHVELEFVCTHKWFEIALFITWNVWTRLITTNIHSFYQNKTKIVQNLFNTLLLSIHSILPVSYSIVLAPLYHTLAALVPPHMMFLSVLHSKKVLTDIKCKPKNSNAGSSTWNKSTFYVILLSMHLRGLACLVSPAFSVLFHFLDYIGLGIIKVLF